MRNARVNVLIGFLVTGVLGVVFFVPAQPMQRKSSSSASSQLRAEDRRFSYVSIDDVLWWLPEDTETVYVARGPFKVTPPTDEPPASVSALEYADLALRMSHLGILQTIEKGRFLEPLVGRSVSFCIQGGRRFRPPKQLGGMLYEGCDIVILQDGLGSPRDLLIRQLRLHARQAQSIAGEQVMEFEERLESDFWKFFVALPAPNVLLCATNRDYLTQVLNRMHQRGQKRALPEDLPEWKHVNTAAKFWAVRHYDNEGAQSDPSSPLSGVLKGANWPDKQAVGIVFDLDPSRSRVATVKYLSANKDAVKLFGDHHSKVDQGFKPVIRENAAGVVEMLVSLDDLHGSGMFLLVLFALLGHAVYV